MDWLRRNWPDLLIGIALVAVIAGIIATLITGGSFFPVGQSTRTNTPQTQNSTTQSVAPQAPSSPSTSSNATSGSSSNATSQSASGSQGATATNGGASSGSAGTATAPSNGGVSVLPPSASAPSSGNGTGAGSSGSASSASAPSGATSSGGASAASGTTSSAAPSGGAQTATANGPGAAAPYRISVGAFSHKDYAQRQEQTFKKAGYPVFLASQGDLTIVLVGPYKSQSQAEQVAGKIKNGGFGVDPVVYQFQGSSDQAPAAASGGQAPAAASGSAAATSSSSATSSASASSGSLSAPSGERYLQVGAYGSEASAKPQKDRLTKMGFTVQEHQENGLIKLLIGPFGSDRLQQVQAQLKSAGIDSFPR